MANKGFFCLDGYLERTAKLSDQELGRLMRACMIYHARGEVTELAGREGIAFDFIKEDIDAANEAYTAKCETNRRNRYGQQPRTIDHDGARTMTVVNGRQRSSTNGDEEAPNATKRDETRKEKGNINKSSARAREDDDDGFITDAEAQRKQIDLSECMDVAESVGVRLNDKTMGTIAYLFAQYGKDALIHALGESAEVERPLAYARKILENGSQTKEQADEWSDWNETLLN